MANNIIRRTWKQGGMVNIEDLRGSAFQAEDGGHTFLISGVDENGDALALSGTPAGVLLRADGQDVTLICSVSDGVVSATLPANAYVVPGRIGITIFLTNGGQKTAIYAAIAAVATTSSGTVAPPAGSDVVDLVNAIQDAIALIPASDANLKAAMAPTYSTSAVYAVGSYAWYDGKLYRCTTAITSGETWTSAHWTLANLGSDVSDLKSAFSKATSVLSGENVVSAGMTRFLDTIQNKFNAFSATVRSNGNSIVINKPDAFTVVHANSNPVILEYDGLPANHEYNYSFNFTNQHIIRFYDTDDTTMLATATNTSGYASFTPPHSKVHIYIYRNSTYHTDEVNFFGIFDSEDPYNKNTNFSEGLYIGAVYPTGITRNPHGVIKAKKNQVTNSRFEMTESFDEMGGWQLGFKTKNPTMGTIYLGKGYNETYGLTVIINTTYVRITGPNSGYYQENHGLTFKDYISFTIETAPNTARSKFILLTNGGKFEKTFTDVIVGGYHGKPYVYAVGTGTVLNDVELSYSCKNWFNPIWIFGDSYLNLGSPQRWTSYLPDESKTNIVMMNGYPGRNSANAIIAFDSAIKNAVPKYLVWALGMNDSYADWLSAIEKVIDVCNKNNIKLIPCTIPNVETVDNQSKNEYIRSHFTDYMEFALAVNTADNSTTWYDNMLSSDEVHPDTEGARALFAEACATIPEIYRSL